MKQRIQFFVKEKDQKFKIQQKVKKQKQEPEDEVVEVFQRKEKKWKIGMKRPEYQAISSGG